MFWFSYLHQGKALLAGVCTYVLPNWTAQKYAFLLFLKFLFIHCIIHYVSLSNSSKLNSLNEPLRFNRILPKWCKCTAISRMSLSHLLWHWSHKNDEALKVSGSLRLSESECPDSLVEDLGYHQNHLQQQKTVHYTEPGYVLLFWDLWIDFRN